MLAWRGSSDNERGAGLGAASAALSQWIMLMWPPAADKPDDAPKDDKPRQARALPPGALESAFERARRRIALDADEAARYRRR